MNAASTRETSVAVGANPFSRWAVLALVLIGSALFLALLWMIGTGTGFGSTNDGQAHADGRGLNGYAAMADYLERRGHPVIRARNAGQLDQPGLLVLTPPAGADGEAIEKIVSKRRYAGPTLVILPKWMAFPSGSEQKDAKPGWVNLQGMQPLEWRGFLDDVTVVQGDVDANGKPAHWRGLGGEGTLPGGKYLQSGQGDALVPLVREQDGRTLAAFLDDGGSYPALEEEALGVMRSEPEDEDRYPLVLVFEPDLVDNWGMADRRSAQLVDSLLAASELEPEGRVTFDLTMNGFGRAQNLLTMAFTPPFLAATLCLLLAGLVLGWRAFLRFGPPLATERAIAFGKRALVANSAGLVLRSRRLHLIGAPYADRARDRLIQALALPRSLAPDQAEAAIDRALASRRVEAEPFSAIAARLRHARKSHDLVKAARDLHALERMLTR
ncbi:DUF4350 domain-containing protein [Novosphingobium lindaniclasticum]|uniref:DUF4350 domain-containing protein n=1 Tax=Novosphingobium lindaniclasticum LE124 TaxID=1096930 RepID=T0J2C1_9SPHN|nr:DUF4350 domain-containing protein [Novosphingobium lindaniclasticum]EQB18270.1 hypothetical protein L284_05090 [Novosphingobium lindaniclasticum LE124]